MRVEHHVPVIETTTQKTHEWLEALALYLGVERQESAYRALRAVLHAVRDRLVIEEAADLGAQLPMLIRGVYYEGWRPAQNPVKERHLDEFLAKIRKELEPESIDPTDAAQAVFKLLNERVTPGETSDVRQMLPQEVRELWPEQ